MNHRISEESAVDGSKQQEENMAITGRQMTAQQAREFGHFSIHNAVQAQMACPQAGTCEAYRDIFTFRRWRAQGFVVRKGEQGTTVTTWIPRTSAKDNEVESSKRRPKGAVLFCRHQVERIAGR